ncbi:hypothetical protein [Microbacter margulisiae]|uniref:Uncharacterized protein n=1 Tax=Microbacter margulisiae TaxID=1350067 RepID=A0A7W5H292_9PORP|nr:hypothetical protein [Microbacter margulisiae]MBB3187187.1 hypothetical protein [Microbacter margulisiae]
MIDYQEHITNYLARGFRPFNPDLLFVLKQKVGKKLTSLKALCSAEPKWDFVSALAETCFSRLCPLRSKNGRSSTQIVQTHSFVAQTGRFLAAASLAFWLTGQGRSPCTNVISFH